MFCDHEVFQVFCQFCFKKFEAKTREEAIDLVVKHEKDKCDKKKEVIEKIS